MIFHNIQQDPYSITFLKEIQTEILSHTAATELTSQTILHVQLDKNNHVFHSWECHYRRCLKSGLSASLQRDVINFMIVLCFIMPPTPKQLQ